MFIIFSFILFTVLVAIISWYKTRDEQLDTQDGYFLAGRSLTGPVIAGSLMMTNLSTEQLVGQAGQSYSTNMGPMAWEATSCIALIILAFVLLPKYLKMGMTTIPEFLEQRFDATLRRLICVLLLLGYLLTYLPTVLYSGALVFNQIFGISDLLHVPQLMGVTLTATAIGIIGAIYAIFGGLKAVAVSDTVNGIGLIVGGIALPLIALTVFGHGNPIEGIAFRLSHDTENCSICRGDGKAVTINPYTATSGKDGRVTFTNIPSGHKYELREVDTPSCYFEDTDQYAVTVAYDALTVTVTHEDGAAGTWDGTIVNRRRPRMPETGGAGTLLYTIGGIALMAIGLLYGCALRRRRERRENR